MSDCRFGVSPVNYPDPDPDRLEVITQNFGSSLTWSQTPEDRFSHEEAHLSIRFDICSIIIQLKVDRKHTLIPFSLLKTFGITKVIKA